MTTKTLTPEQAAQAGFARFNNGNHLCVDLPPGPATISVRTADGKRVTFAFCPYSEDGIQKCVDIQQHDTEETVINGSLAVPIQNPVIFTCGSTLYRRTEDQKPTLVTLLLNK
jgi:hypothetical protein